MNSWITPELQAEHRRMCLPVDLNNVSIVNIPDVVSTTRPHTSKCLPV